MNTHIRMVDGSSAPSEQQLAAFIGAPAFRRWRKLVADIEERYPSVFAPDWIFGGKKHGWALRFKKSKSFCTLIPEANGFAVQIVFGRDERAKMKEVVTRLKEDAREAYAKASVFHDGKWFFLPVDSDVVLPDIFEMLSTKRKLSAARKSPTIRQSQRRKPSRRTLSHESPN